MLGKKKPTEPLDPEIENRLAEATPTARDLVGRFQAELCPYLVKDGAGLIACGISSGILNYVDSLIVFTKYGLRRLPAEAISKMGTHDDRYQTRTISLLFDMAATGQSRKHELGGFEVEFATQEGFETAAKVLSAWWGLFGPT